MKLWKVRINEGFERSCGFRHENGLLVTHGASLFGPGFYRLLHKPQSSDVLQETVGPSVTSLIGEVRFKSLIIENQFIQFDPKQTPGSA